MKIECDHKEKTNKQEFEKSSRRNNQAIIYIRYLYVMTKKVGR